MTKLDRAFMKAYGRPWRESAAPRQSAQPSVPFQRGLSLHRIDPPGEQEETHRSEPAAGRAPYVYSLPTVDELNSHAVSVSEAAELLQLQPATLSVEASVAATAAELSLAWPTRFTTDSPALLDHQPALALADGEPTSDNQPTLATVSAARPLSAFAPVESVSEPVRPLLEVDRFQWPLQSNELCATLHAALDGFVSRLLSGAAEGQSRVALVGAQSAVGRTMLAMTVARRAAAQGANWVLLDADFAQPELAPQLGIIAEIGWSQVLGGQRELGESMIASIEDRLAIVPLEAQSLRPEQLIGNFRAPALFDTLAESYELLLIDAGSPGLEGIEGLAALHQASRFDVAYVVYDARSTDEGTVADYARRLTAAGISVAGAIENFAPRPSETAAW